MTALGEKIGKARLARGLSYRDMAKLCALSPATIHRLETGATRPNIVMLVELAEVLNISLRALAYAAADDYRDSKSP